MDEAAAACASALQGGVGGSPLPLALDMVCAAVEHCAGLHQHGLAAAVADCAATTGCLEMRIGVCNTSRHLATLLDETQTGKRRLNLPISLGNMRAHQSSRENQKPADTCLGLDQSARTKTNWNQACAKEYKLGYKLSERLLVQEKCSTFFVNILQHGLAANISD